MDEDSLLIQWEESYKKGLLSFWILLLLDQRPCYPFEMNALINDLSQGAITADANSIYRALNRFEDVGLVTSEVQPSSQGPYRRYYRLSDKGRRVLARFIQRNIRIFESPPVADRIQSVCNHTPTEEKE